MNASRITYDEWQKKNPPRIMCGGCKATGYKHAWTKDADYKIVEPRERCPDCGGSGFSNRQDDASL